MLLHHVLRSSQSVPARAFTPAAAICGVPAPQDAENLSRSQRGNSGVGCNETTRLERVVQAWRAVVALLEMYVRCVSLACVQGAWGEATLLGPSNVSSVERGESFHAPPTQDSTAGHSQRPQSTAPDSASSHRARPRLGCSKYTRWSPSPTSHAHSTLSCHDTGRPTRLRPHLASRRATRTSV